MFSVFSINLTQYIQSITIKNYRFAAFVFAIITILLEISCDAPRLNPLDPSNPDVKKGIIAGYINTESLPHSPMKGVLVKYNNTYVGESDVNGYFEIIAEIASNINLIFEKSGYIADTIIIDSKTQNRLEVFLNQTPHLDTLTAYSVVMSRYSLPPIVQLVIKGRISDSDKDIDSVFAFNEEFGISEQLIYNSNDKFYGKELYTYNIDLDNLEELIGKSIRIVVKDTKLRNFEVGDCTLKRVISSAIEHYSPSNYDTVGTNPELRWYTYEPNFSCTYKVEVYSYEVDFSTVLVWSKENLSSELTSITIDKTLPEGNYFWVIWCVDLYSNRIRSNPASFYIKN